MPISGVTNAASLEANRSANDLARAMPNTPIVGARGPRGNTTRATPTRADARLTLGVSRPG